MEQPFDLPSPICADGRGGGYRRSTASARRIAWSIVGPCRCSRPKSPAIPRQTQACNLAANASSVRSTPLSLLPFFRGTEPGLTKFGEPKRLGQGWTMSTKMEKSRTEDASPMASKYESPRGMKNTTLGTGGGAFSIDNLSNLLAHFHQWDIDQGFACFLVSAEGQLYMHFKKTWKAWMTPWASEAWSVLGWVIRGRGARGTICCAMVEGFWHLSSRVQGSGVVPAVRVMQRGEGHSHIRVRGAVRFETLPAGEMIT